MSKLTEHPQHRDQRTIVKRDLLAGKVLTQQTAALRHGVWRLSAVIERIRHRDGWPVQTIIDPRDRHALYSLPKNWTPPTGPAHAIGGTPEILNGDTLDADGAPL